MEDLIEESRNELDVLANKMIDASEGFSTPVVVSAAFHVMSTALEQMEKPQRMVMFNTLVDHLGRVVRG